MLTDGSGYPLAVVIAPANRHDSKLLEPTLRALVVRRPRVCRHRPQHLCLDKAYDTPACHALVRRCRYRGHIRPIGEKPLDSSHPKRFPARRWVVERALAWFSKCRGLLVRYEKKAGNYLGMMELGSALLWYRRLVRISF